MDYGKLQAGFADYIFGKGHAAMDITRAAHLDATGKRLEIARFELGDEDPEVCTQAGEIVVSVFHAQKSAVQPKMFALTYKKVLHKKTDFHSHSGK